MDLHWANAKTHIPLCFAGDGGNSVTSLNFFCPRGWNNRSCLSNQYALHDLKRTVIPHFAKFTVKVYFVVSGFCAWVDQQAGKEKQADYHHHSAHERLHGQCFCYTSSYKSCETTVCATLVQFLFRSRVCAFFSLRRHFPLKCCRESSGNKSFNENLLKMNSFCSGRRPPKPWLRVELKSPIC